MLCVVVCVRVYVSENVCVYEGGSLWVSVQGGRYLQEEVGTLDWALYCAGSRFYALIFGGGLLDAGVMGIR